MAHPVRRNFAHLSPAVRRLRVHSIFGYACVVLAAYEVGALPPELTGDALVTEIVDACCGLVEAPTSNRLVPDPITKDRG